MSHSRSGATVALASKADRTAWIALAGSEVPTAMSGTETLRAALNAFAKSSFVLIML